MFSSSVIRNDFPLLKRKISKKHIVYLDSTATSLKPAQVIDKENEYNTIYTANIFRGIYKISEEATEEYENVRKKVTRFINAKNSDEIVFTRNTTESLNLVAAGIGKTFKQDDEVVVSIMEHHSNFVPWQQRAIRKGIRFRILGLDDNYQLNFNELDRFITRKTKVLAITSVSNVLGTINPVKQIVKTVKSINPHCLVVVDGAQAVPHMNVDVNDWNADFVAFSSHKMLGPTGVGVLWGKMEHLENLSPYQYGGEMIQEVYVEKTIFKKPPHKFEAGTPHIAGVIGFGAAVDYLSNIGMDNVRKHEKELTAYALNELNRVTGIRIYGSNDVEHRGGVIAFTIKSAHAHDIAQILDEDNICIRSGNHCAMPLHTYLKLPATARASFYIYTTKEDVDTLIKGLEKVGRIFR